MNHAAHFIFTAESKPRVRINVALNDSSHIYVKIENSHQEDEGPSWDEISDDCDAGS